ncbi:hypothetical protein HBI82_000920 [Parastagonospora nodorum]|nr:hypothetical protein HBH77_026140 [Parastagonospora nodorum]KAH5373504.1 hypothetical protein HBI48_016440 [Parastagonospora nodorum]KAH5658209.1 hypothetical protein HBI23_137640 [Parastagonospora nodorum]KAH6040538.1 hypothetical protein HBI82_000920 [Parastagonospora nodorum]
MLFLFSHEATYVPDFELDGIRLAPCRHVQTPLRRHARPALQRPAAAPPTFTRSCGRTQRGPFTQTCACQRCDGVRPRCSACVARDTDCRYGETEARQIRRRYQELKLKRTAEEELFYMLQTMNEQDAGDVFRRIRTGAKAESLVRHIQESSLVLGLSLAPETHT